jgi:DNA gyrase/topoisomerase IV subunit A
LFRGRSDSPSTDLERHPKRPHKSSLIGQSPEQLQAKGGTGKQISKGETAQVAELTQKFNQAMKKKEAEWQAKERELEDQLGRMQSQNQRLENGIQQIQGELEHRTRILEAKVQEAKSEKEEVEAEYNLFFRQKQEEKFKEMESWLPVEGSKVIGDLDRLKRDMRAFGKGMSTNDLSIFQRLDEADHVALLNDLAEVCVLTNDGLPEGLTSSKSPALLLNALLAHHVYTTLFKNPFFFLGNGLGDVLPKSGLDSLLNEIYSRTQQGKCIQDFRRW